MPLTDLNNWWLRLWSLLLSFKLRGAICVVTKIAHATTQMVRSLKLSRRYSIVDSRTVSLNLLFPLLWSEYRTFSWFGSSTSMKMTLKNIYARKSAVQLFKAFRKIPALYRPFQTEFMRVSEEMISILMMSRWMIKQIGHQTFTCHDRTLILIWACDQNRLLKNTRIALIGVPRRHAFTRRSLCGLSIVGILLELFSGGILLGWPAIVAFGTYNYTKAFI